MTRWYNAAGELLSDDEVGEAIALWESQRQPPPTTPPARCEYPHGPVAVCGDCWGDIPAHMALCKCAGAPWCVPHAADGVHQWRSLCALPHDHVQPPSPADRAAQVGGCNVVGCDDPDPWHIDAHPAQPEPVE